MVNNKIDFPELKEIVKKLRSDDGCPWDREQDENSIKNHLLEETHEIILAIENKDYENLKEEIGDVMFQLLFLAELAEEKGHFTIYDSIAAAYEKFIRRHPHVFPPQGFSPQGSDNESGATGVVDEPMTSDEVLKLWDSIKKTEKPTDDKDILRSVPRTLPALMRALEVSKIAGKAGFDWEESSQVIDKISEEIEELRGAIATDNLNDIEGELGDIIFSIVNLCRFYKLNPENTLNRTTNKFIKRFSHVQKRAGYDLSNKGLDELESYWKEAKNL